MGNSKNKSNWKDYLKPLLWVLGAPFVFLGFRYLSLGLGIEIFIGMLLIGLTLFALGIIVGNKVETKKKELNSYSASDNN